MILVTGVSGLLGMTLAITALDRGFTVTGIYNSHPINCPDMDSKRLDLTNARSVRRLIQRLQPDCIIHCAALTAVDWCEDHPDETRAVNVGVSENLAKSAYESGAGFVYISTDSVFDGTKHMYREEDQPNPLNLYAASKLEAERIVTDILPDCLILRTNIYGWNAQDKQSLSEWALHRFANGDIVPGFKDVTLCPISVNDLSDVILDLIMKNSSGLFHAAGSESCTKYEFARRIATVFGFASDGVHPVSIDSLKMRANRPKDTSMSTDKITRELGRLMPNLNQGIKRLKQLSDSGFPSRLKSVAR